LPAITSINFVMGSTQGGQLLEIKGTGFSTIMSNLTVIIGNTIVMLLLHLGNLWHVLHPPKWSQVLTLYMATQA